MRRAGAHPRGKAKPVGRAASVTSPPGNRTAPTFCDRLVQDAPFLTERGRLSEQQVDSIVLQLNRYHPQVLSDREAEKFRNPQTSLRVRLCDLLSHLQRSSEQDCREFYRALCLHAQPLHSRLPSRHALRPMSFLACLGVAAGLAVLLYCCPPDPKVLPGARRVLGFSPVILQRHVSRYLLAFLADDPGGP
ncbi:caspase recruitment domain-containing protein 19-like isoform X6 [Choloepus didactylus]|uniref:caspase recruitment domain-containing protein 19-like isoform X6 n=1 Tax=Choloepus didactylus TaxID=27675 RepID=UPI00189FD415|nr:caspase recruitment domain-containing protein 19-like isoform X6 [Choloepus didactylus]